MRSNKICSPSVSSSTPCSQVDHHSHDRMKQRMCGQAGDEGSAQTVACRDGFDAHARSVMSCSNFLFRFKVIYSGQWLMPQVRSQAPASIYASLSPNALQLIDLLIKPQHYRPTIDQVLKHNFFASGHAGNAPPSSSSSKSQTIVPSKRMLYRSGSQ
jgi:hypothetical protein